jgi:acetamidase/formamidase
MPAMHHAIEGSRPNLHGHYSASARPILTVESGDTVTMMNIPDVGWGLEPPVSTTAPRSKAEPRENGPCLCGPVAVRGAKAGHTLEIGIEHIRTAEWGWTYAGGGMSTPALYAALGVGDAPLTLVRWAIDRERHIATSHLGHTVPLRPFAGCIGLAPGEAQADGWTPRACGGNMDCRELVAGSTLYLPVMAEGGLLSIGDGHAAQGDGELSGTAVETMLEEVRLQITLWTDLPIRGPRARTPAGWVTLGFAATLDEAAAAAASNMLDLIEQQLGLPRAEALALASARVSLRITQMVNPLRGVHAILHE